MKDEVEIIRKRWSVKKETHRGEGRCKNDEDRKGNRMVRKKGKEISEMFSE